MGSDKDRGEGEAVWLSRRSDKVNLVSYKLIRRGETNAVSGKERKKTG